MLRKVERARAERNQKMRIVVFIFILTAMLRAPGWCDQLTEDEILGQADARIEKYRKGDVELRLIGPGRAVAAGRDDREDRTNAA